MKKDFSYAKRIQIICDLLVLNVRKRQKGKARLLTEVLKYKLKHWI